ncbi:MAG: tyrosine-type recombinase/integrase, partial [Nocardioidaceae bacterium]
MPRSAPTDKIFLDHNQVAALAEACGDYGTLVRVLAYTGLRWGEVTALRVRRVDLRRRRLHVVEAASDHSGMITIGTPKSHQQRQVPFPAFLAGELATLLHARQADDLVFTARSGGRLRNGNFRRDVYDSAAAKVGLRGLRIHDLRHTAANLAKHRRRSQREGSPADAGARVGSHDA